MQGGRSKGRYGYIRIFKVVNQGQLKIEKRKLSELKQYKLCDKSNY